MATNNILGFGTAGSNELSQVAYAADAQRLSGNVPGIARSQLVNKAMHQASAIAAGVAQYIADRQATNVDDTLTPAQVAAMLAASASGRLIRRLVYSRVAGVQNVSINGSAPTTTGASTYTPGATMAFCIAKVQAAGGAGGGPTLPSAGNVTLGSPGGSGAYGEGFFLAATVGASQTITVGLKGAKAAGAVGGTGGTSSFGALLTAAGGIGGGILANQVPPAVAGNSSNVTATGANLFQIKGTGATATFSVTAAANGGLGGCGGVSAFGGGGPGAAGNSSGIDAVNPGSGGSGAVINNGFGGVTAGGDGGDGIVIIEEYAA